MRLIFSLLLLYACMQMQNDATPSGANRCPTGGRRSLLPQATETAKNQKTKGLNSLSLYRQCCSSKKVQVE
jgi:hypothetical protein